MVVVFPNCEVLLIQLIVFVPRHLHLENLLTCLTLSLLGFKNVLKTLKFTFIKPVEFDDKCLNSYCDLRLLYFCKFKHSLRHLSRCFYPKWLTLYSMYTFSFDQFLLFLGIKSTTLSLLVPYSTVWACKCKNCELFLSALLTVQIFLGEHEWSLWAHHDWESAETTVQSGWGGSVPVFGLSSMTHSHFRTGINFLALYS